MMKYYLTFFTIISFTFSTFCQTKEFIKIKLVDFSSVELPPKCGREPFGVALKFELLENLDSTNKGENILIIITCPIEIGVENYKDNSHFKFSRYTDKEEIKMLEKDWNVWSVYENENLPTYWADQIEKIE
ncbi:hypothetical protein EQG68_10210 [Flavobacterium piscinae]|uniref:Uncharacterized protein n=1 Tax=Flavobacterium piscinae TaxID=2506424 RepID=A0A4Q1KMM7_9FLAO|nr:hypothetical protein [Flavobacterium piscinae]RXR31251.1 hypothetical protein EQG68_10210 [Flavobacterium piscinae]